MRVALLCGCLLVGGLPLTGGLPAFAQEAGDDADSEGTNDEAETPLEAGAYALQFQVTSDFRLESFQGSTISVKRHFSARSALRVGLSLSANSQDEGPREQFDEDSTFTSNEETVETDNQGGTLSAQYVHYAFVERPITLFYGAGPRISYRRIKRNREGTGNFGMGTHRFSDSVESTALGVGVLGVLGGEWFVRPDLSLSA